MDIAEIKSVFEARANPSEALKMKNYMRGQFEYLGIKSPIRAELRVEILTNKELKNLSAEDLMPLIYELWMQPCREYQYIAMELLDRKIKAANPEMIEHLEFLVVTKSWWDTIDFIASHLVGTLFRVHPEIIKKYVAKWMNSDNMWLQRTVLLYQLKYRKNLDEKILFNAIIELKASKEFFIQKAIGWALREYGKSNPESVVEFVGETELASLSKREALRRIVKTS
jgi:3-methyladenine DNA glycosylase AlkD